MVDWNRLRSFDPKVRGDYSSLLYEGDAAEQANEGRSKGGDGRGDAAMGGAPRPQPGDELHAAITHAQADKDEKDRRADIVARRDHDHDQGPSILALALLAEASRNSSQQTQDQQQPAPARQPEQDGPQTSFQSMRAAQADIGVPSPEHKGGASIDAPKRPGLGKSLYDEVTPQTHAEVEAGWKQQAQEQSKKNTLGLSL